MNNDISEFKISDIKVGTRHRKDMGDIEELAQSIEETGLLQPIGITPDNELVFGERRLRAYRDVMKHETIPARIVAVESMLHAQIAEDVMRKSYTVSEQVAIVESLRSFTQGGDRRSNQICYSEDEAVTLDEACRRVGISKDSYYRAQEVDEKGIPALKAAMDNGEIAVSAAAKLAEASQDEQVECMERKFDAEKLTARAIKKQLGRIKNRTQREEDEKRAVRLVNKDDSIQIHHCRFQALEKVAGLAPNSVQLICTDIPYGKDFIDQIEELAAIAERVLVDGGTFVSYLGQHRLNDKLATLDKHLTYRWLGTTAWEGMGSPIHPLNMASKNIPWVVYSKGDFQASAKWIDTFVKSPRQKDWHPWQRPLNEVEELVRYFSKPGDLVVDPCGGGFTTAIACHNKKRRFIGCDEEKVAVVKGQERLAKERSEPAALPMKEIRINTVTEGDCRDLIPALPDGSINLCVTSPPYAERRNGNYPGVPDDEYADFTVDWMSKLWDKLTEDGSVLIVIDPAIKNGVVADYVLRTQVALRDYGWKQHRTQIWLKRDRAPLGHKRWPRECYEPILWFSKSAKPFCDARACGIPSDRVGSPSYRYSDWSNGNNSDREGIARSTNVWDIPVGEYAKSVDHPAKFPVALPKALIQTFCPPGGVVLDNFSGSGSTLIAAKELGHPFYGFDIVPEFVEMAKQRLEDVDPPAIPKVG